MCSVWNLAFWIYVWVYVLCTFPKALKLATVVTLVSSITITSVIVTTPVITPVDTACYYHDYNISVVALVSRPSEIHAFAMLLFPTVRHWMQGDVHFPNVNIIAHQNLRRKHVDGRTHVTIFICIVFLRVEQRAQNSVYKILRLELKMQAITRAEKIEADCPLRWRRTRRRRQMFSCSGGFTPNANAVLYMKYCKYIVPRDAALFMWLTVWIKPHMTSPSSGESWWL
jgi:hypothetical protein